MVCVTAQGDQWCDASVFAGFDVVLAEVAVVGQQGVRVAPFGRQFIQLVQHRLDLLFIVGLLSKPGGDDQHAVDIHRRLAVVSLHKAFVAGHDPGFFVGQINLVFGLRACFGCFGFFAARFFSRFALGFAASDFVSVLLLGLLIALGGTLGNLDFGIGQNLQALFATSDFGGQVVFVVGLLLIGFRRFGQQGLYFLA